VQTLARGLIPVRVHAVTPRLMDTPLFDTADGAAHDTIVNNRAAIFRRDAWATVGEVAQVIRMLMTHDYITGEVGKGMTPVSLAPNVMPKTAF
jgi:NAD(P)-dependent dehydrogenase (short-subunit alcohol dehydrogenase family)